MHQQNKIRQSLLFVKNRLSTANIQVESSWFTECVEFFISDIPNISNEDLYNKTKEQWLLSDLAEVGIELLTQHIPKDSKDFILNGKFPLQLMFLVDISESCYDQLNNLYDKKLDEAEEVREYNVPVKKKRMLKLELTDGKTTIIGMEYTPIPCLTTKLTPGCKIMLTGPMRCVNKVLFLETKNVTILGGEIDSLLVENAYENVLLRALGKPINPHPKEDYRENTIVVEPKRTIIPSVTSVFVPKSCQNQNMEMMDEDEMLMMSINLDEVEQNAFSRATTVSMPITKPEVPYFNPDDDALFDDLDLLEQIEKEVNLRQNTEPPPLRNAIENLQTKSINIHKEEPKVTRQAQLNNKNKVQSTISSYVSIIEPKVARQMPLKPVNDQINTSTVKLESYLTEETKNIFSDSSLFDDSCLFDVKEESDIDVSSIFDTNYEFKLNGINLVLINKICEKNRKELNGKTFIIYAKIDNIAEKLKVCYSKFSMSVILTDNSKKILQTSVRSDVIEKLIGYTANEFIEIKNMSKTNQQLKNDIMDILSSFRIKLQNLNCFIKIEYDKDQYPVIIDIFEKTTITENILLKMLQKEGIF